QEDVNGDGVIDINRTDVTVINADGSRTETATDFNSNGTTLDRTVTTTSANGLSSTVQIDLIGSGTFNATRTDVKVLNA
ncbi:hypothetical protein ABTA67_20480, partial [Acinetobacter baumannii]